MMTMLLAAQGTRLATKAQMRRSLSVSIMRQPRQAGTLQPKPSIMGMNPLPCRPIWCIAESMRKAILARYPESSSRERTT